MRKILRPPELVDDPWRYAGQAGTEATEGAETSTGTAGTIVPVAEFLANPALFTGATSGGRTGVRVGPADKVEDLAPHLANIALVAVEFPSIGEGRGYSFARLLRQRYGFQGEIRAVGPAVKRDLLLAMARNGFDSFDLAPGQSLEQALAGLATFSFATQAGVPVKGVEVARYTSNLR